MKKHEIKKNQDQNHQIEFKDGLKVSEELHKRIQEAPKFSMEQLEALCED